MSNTDPDSTQNFRSHYYHKLGSTSAVDEKKNLKKLLNATPLDLKKLEQFCLHLHLPNDFRCELWKILLKISPIYQSTIKYVADQRLAHFEELERVSQSMRIDTTGASSDGLAVYVAMYIIESRIFPLNAEHLFELEEARIFCDVITAVCRMDLVPCDTYWISRNFTNLILQRVHDDIPRLVERTHSHLQREDIGGKIQGHLLKVGAYDKIPYNEWFANCFSKVLPETSFERLWDKVISGSTVVLVFIAVSMVIINRRPILVMKNTSQILNIFIEMKTDTADEVVRRGIELWLRNGGKITPSSTRASPAVATERSPTPTSLHSIN